jgi:hypothetical protein
MKLKKLVLMLALASSSVFADDIDLTLNSSGWTNVAGQSLTGPQTFQAGPNAWAISPYTGSTMVGLQPNNPSNSYANMASALGLSSSSVTALSAEIAAQNPQGGGNITNAAWISKNFTFTSPASFHMYWVYTSTDYVPFNDGSITTLVNTTNASDLAKINGLSKQYLLLGATNPGTGNYSTGSYGSTGWQIVNYDIVTAGTYKLGFAAFNQGDTALSPILNVNDGLGTVTQNGTTFGAVAPNDPTMPSSPSVTPPSAPTVTGTSTTDNITSSSVNGNPITTNSITYGDSTTTVTSSNAKGQQTPKTLTITQTTVATQTTPFTLTTTVTTPVTTTTTTTPVTTTTYSDNTTTTTNGTPVVTTSTTNNVSSSNVSGTEIIEVDTHRDYATRVDQLEKLSKINSQINQSLLSDPLSRNKVVDGRISSKSFTDGDSNFYINAIGGKSNTNDGYNNKFNIFGFGHEKKIDSDLLVGVQYNHAYSSLTGDTSNGTLNKDSFGLYGIRTIEDWIIKGDLGVSFNSYNTTHTLPELGLGNSAKTNGTDYWAAMRTYTPSNYGFRPFAGVRVNKSTRKHTTDEGSEVSAISYDSINTTKTTGEIGIRHEYEFNKYLSSTTELFRNTESLTSAHIGLLYVTENMSTVSIKFIQQRQDGWVNNMGQINLRMNF